MTNPARTRSSRLAWMAAARFFEFDAAVQQTLCYNLDMDNLDFSAKPMEPHLGASKSEAPIA